VIADGKTDAILENHAAWQQTGLILPEWFLRGRHAEATR
jgi:hypothetical protein